MLESNSDPTKIGKDILAKEEKAPLPVTNCAI